jgi:hypothetical protein
VELNDAKDAFQKEKHLEELQEIQWLIEASARVKNTKLDLTPEWFHFALTSWIGKSKDWSFAELPELAQNLGLEEKVLSQAITDLISKGVLVTHQADATRVLHSTNLVSLLSEVPNQVFRKIHSDMLEKSQTALQNQGPDRRYSASEFYSFSAEGFEELKNISNRYLDQVEYLSQKDTNKKKLVCVSLHAFELIPEKKS